MPGPDPYEQAAAAVRRAVGWTTGGGRPIVLMAWAFISALFLGAQWLFALRLGFRPDEIGIGPTASIAHAAVGLALVLLAVGSTVLVVAALDHGVALLTAFVWELAILARGSTRTRRLVGAAVVVATTTVAVAVAYHVEGKTARPASLGVVSGSGLLVIWSLWGGMHRADPLPLSPRWEVSWLGGMLTTTALIGAAAYLDITDGLRSIGTVPFLVVSLVGALVVAVALAVLSSGSPPNIARWLPSRDRPGVVAVGTMLLAAVIVGSWTLSTAVHDARIVRQGHVPSALGRFVIGIPIQCVDVHMLQGSGAARVDRPLLRLGSGSTTLLVEPGKGVMHLPTGAVQTVGRPDGDCSG